MSTIFTIGHSNQPAAEFMDLLKKHDIERLIDVRSNPYSRYRHFNWDRLEERLKDEGIDYWHLGEPLGGHPSADEFYEKGRVVYERIAGSSQFRNNISAVVDESEKHRIVLMCTEENPLKCHRHPLLAQALLERGAEVIHIRRKGPAENAKALQQPPSAQLPLLEPVGEDLTWHSPKRIRRPGQS